MSNIFRLPKVKPLSVCPTTPHPQPTPLALRSAAAAVSSDPENYINPLPKVIVWNTGHHHHFPKALTISSMRMLRYTMKTVCC